MTTEIAAGAHHDAPTSIEYIQHHLTHLKNAEGTINLDTFWVSAILGLIFLLQLRGKKLREDSPTDPATFPGPPPASAVTSTPAGIKS